MSLRIVLRCVRCVASHACFEFYGNRALGEKVCFSTIYWNIDLVSVASSGVRLRFLSKKVGFGRSIVCFKVRYILD